MLTEAAQRLAEAGWATVLPDLFGTGDSEGEFRDAQVERWIDDIEQACRHAAERGLPVRAVLAVRFGCALAVAAARRVPFPPSMRAFGGSPCSTAGGTSRSSCGCACRGGYAGDSEETVDSLRVRSAAGETLAVAATNCPRAGGGPRDAGGRGPAATGWIAALVRVRARGRRGAATARDPISGAVRAAGAVASITTLAVEPFWASAEIVRSTELVERTEAVLTVAGTVDSDRPQSPVR